MRIADKIKNARIQKGYTQEQVAENLLVSRQTISNWENGRSVPDSDMLIAISEVLEIPVSTLLGETVTEPKTDDLKVISEKLEIINLQLARSAETRRKVLRWLFILLCAAIVAGIAALAAFGSPYLGWDYSDPETAVAGVAFHAFEWLFVRAAPVIFAGSVAGICLTRNRG